VAFNNAVPVLKRKRCSICTGNFVKKYIREDCFLACVSKMFVQPFNVAMLVIQGMCIGRTAAFRAQLYGPVSRKIFIRSDNSCVKVCSAPGLGGLTGERKTRAGEERSRQRGEYSGNINRCPPVPRTQALIPQRDH
jgi:hypothetical protein